MKVLCSPPKGWCTHTSFCEPGEHDSSSSTTKTGGICLFVCLFFYHCKSIISGCIMRKGLNNCQEVVKCLELSKVYVSVISCCYILLSFCCWKENMLKKTPILVFSRKSYKKRFKYQQIYFTVKYLHVFSLLKGYLRDNMITSTKDRVYVRRRLFDPADAGTEMYSQQVQNKGGAI